MSKSMTCVENTVRKERASSTSRSQHREQCGGVTPRPPSARSRERKEGIKPAAAVPVQATRRSGGANSARSDLQEGARASARSAGTAASFSSSTNGRGLQALGSGRGSISARTTPRSLMSSAVSLTDFSTDTPRETARTTTTTAMSTARAEAALAVLEAERAQLEHRLKKVEDELRQEQRLAMGNRKRALCRGVPPRTTR